MNLKPKANLSGKEKLYEDQRNFNCTIGEHYPHQVNEYSKSSVPWLKTYVEILNHAQDYIGAPKEDCVNLYETKIHKAFNEAIKIIQSSVKDCIEELERVRKDEEENRKKMVFRV